jgi:GC-rich sequence DNA-binding factor
LGIGKPKELLIPDQATIEAIFAKWEWLRKSSTAAPDYISLDRGSNHGEAEGLSDVELEFLGRIAMFGEKKNKTGSTDTKKTKKGVFEDDNGDERATSVHFAKDSKNGESAVICEEKESERERATEKGVETGEERECYFSIRIKEPHRFGPSAKGLFYSLQSPFNTSSSGKKKIAKN